MSKIDFGMQIEQAVRQFWTRVESPLNRLRADIGRVCRSRGNPEQQIQAEIVESQKSFEQRLVEGLGRRLGDAESSAETS